MKMIHIKCETLFLKKKKKKMSSVVVVINTVRADGRNRVYSPSLMSALNLRTEICKVY